MFDKRHNQHPDLLWKLRLNPVCDEHHCPYHLLSGFAQHSFLNSIRLWVRPVQPELNAYPRFSVGCSSMRHGDWYKGVVFGVNSFQSCNDCIGCPDFGDFRELVLVIKGFYNGNGSFDSVDGLDEQGCQRAASTESLVSDVGDRRWHRKACQRGASIESKISDAVDRIWDHKACQRAASPESTVFDAGDGRWNHKTCQRTAILESTSSDVGDGRWNRKTCQRTASSESLDSDAVHRIWDHKACQRAASIESTVSDAGN